MTKPSRRAILGALALAAALAVACSGAGAPSSTLVDQNGGTPQLGVVGRAVPAASAAAAPAVAPEAQRAGSAADAKANTIPVPQAFDPDRALILTANVAMRAKDAWTVSEQVQRIALGLGGDVLSLAQSGSGEQKGATLQVRVPQARFNDALRQIREIGEVEVVSSNVEGKDVTDQFVDLQARLKAKQDEEQRYLSLLGRANTVDEILKIDAVLGNVRAQIEQLTGQINSIKARTTYSTVTVRIDPLVSPVPTPSPLTYDPSKTAERAVAALAALMRVGLDAAIWGLVFGWIPLMGLGIALLFARSRARVAPMA